MQCNYKCKVLQERLQDKDNQLEEHKITKMDHKSQDYKTYNTINSMMKRIEILSERSRLMMNKMYNDKLVYKERNTLYTSYY